MKQIYIVSTNMRAVGRVISISSSEDLIYFYWDKEDTYRIFDSEEEAHEYCEYLHDLFSDSIREGVEREFQDLEF